MKMQYFDRNLIREYMEGSSALEQGIRYFKYLNPSASDALAKESAIRYAIEKCEAIWMKDSTGYISSERMAFSVFANDVKEKRHFHDKAMDNAEKKKQKAMDDAEKKKQTEENAKKERANRWKHEKARVERLKEYCQTNGLDFKSENKKAVDDLLRKNSLTTWIESISALAFIGAAIMWWFTSIGNYLLWLPIIVASAVAFFVADEKLDPKIPDDFVQQIKDGRYDITK